MADSNNLRSTLPPKEVRLRKLTVEQVEQIDQFLNLIGDYGEVHLIVQHGEVKYINKVESHKVWKEKRGDST